MTQHAARRVGLEDALESRIRMTRLLLVGLAALGLAYVVKQNFNFGLAISQSAEEERQWKVLTSGQDSNLRGLSAVYAGERLGERGLVIWASGSNGVVLRSEDGGRNWKPLNVAGGEKLDFRGIRAFDDQIAYLMSSGEGDQSRLYKTTDGGISWKLQYSGAEKEFFLDALVCESETHCFALSDPVDGKFVLLETRDGEKWIATPSHRMPMALKGEGAFAASCTSLALCGNSLLFGTGGPTARVFRSTDSGASWNAVEVPIASGNASSGIFSLACSGASVVVAGGDYQQPGRSIRTAAYSRDGGKTWSGSPEPPAGYRSAVAALGGERFLAVGPTGADLSSDGGVHWTQISETGFNALLALYQDEVFAAGSKGVVAQFGARAK